MWLDGVEWSLLYDYMRSSLFGVSVVGVIRSIHGLVYEARGSEFRDG